MTGGPPYALITGCSSGIGKSLATAFAAKGMTVLATARKVESLHELTDQHENIEGFALELSDMASIDRLKDVVARRTGGRLDYLVNNAGTQYQTTALDADISKVADLFAINVFAVMRLCQVFVPLLREAQRGRIVQIGSVTRATPVVWQAPYNASKAALSQYSKTLRLELQPFDIEIIEIVTGFVQSNILHGGFNAPDDSLYLPIKGIIEKWKRQGNANGTDPDVYARSVVDKVTRKHAGIEIWEGTLAWILRFAINWLPLRLFNWILIRQFKLSLLNRPKTL